MIKVEKVKKKKELVKQETVCLANGLEVSKFENFKKGSDFLKEPLASELKNESDHFTNDAVQLLKSMEVINKIIENIENLVKVKIGR